MKVCPSCRTGTYGSPAACPGCGVSLSSVGDRAGDDLAGMVIDQKYELTELIGEGAMGWVYRGLHRSLDSAIAVKLMKPSGAPDEARDQRFAREAKAVSRLNNPHVISIIDFGSTPGGMLYIVSEYLSGRTLSSLLLDEPELPLERALQIMDQVLSAVDEAHGAGLVHRDLKPDNIIITPMRSGEDFVKILDFGIAKIHDPGSQRLTMQGQLFGTPAYMAPEQIRGQEVTNRSDLYSCALILYEMLTGQEPFQSESVMEVLSMQLHNAPAPFAEVAPTRQISPALEALVMRGLSKDPAERFGSAAELRDALHAAVGLRRKTGAIPILGVCGSCGLPIAHGSKFCTECGARQGDQPSPPIALSATLLGDLGREAALAARAPEPARVEAAPAEVETALPLVGREIELLWLEAFLGGEGRIAQLLGPLGSGRSRLLEAAGALASALGLRVVRAGSDPLGVRTPLGPVRSLVAQLLGFDAGPVAPEAVKSKTLAAGLGAEDVVGIAEILGISVLGGQVEYAVRRREIRAAVVRLIRDTPLGKRGLCLLLDDADEYDGASLSILRSLLEGGAGERIFAILVGERQPLVPSAGIATLQVPPLGPEAVAQLVAQQTLSPASGDAQAVARSLWAASEGLPLHVTQALLSLAEGGSDASLPLDALLAERLERLPGGARRALEAVATLGREAALAPLEQLLGAPAGLGASLQLLEQRDFLRRSAERRWEVTHPSLGVAAREAQSPEGRSQLHRRALEVLEEAGATPHVLARHARECQRGEEALALLRSAGEQSAGNLDDAGAALLFHQALQLARWELLLEESSPECLELSLRLGDALRFSGDLSGAALVLKEAVALAGAFPMIQARLLRGLGRVHLAQKDEAAGLCLLRDAVRAGIFSGSPDLLCELYADLGRALLDAGRPAEAAGELNEGVALVTSGDGPDAARTPPQFWRLLLHLGEAELGAGRPQAALDPAVSALGQAREVPSLVGQARSHLLLAQVFDRLDREGAASEQYSAAQAAFRLLGDRQSAAECLLAKAERRPDERRTLAGQALALAREVLWEAGQRRAEALLTHQRLS